MFKKILFFLTFFFVFSELSTIEAGKKPSKSEKSSSNSDQEDVNSNFTPIKPEEKKETKRLKDLEEIFDIEHYKQEHGQEIIESGLLPLEHFMQHGWEKGHQPAIWFKPEEVRKHFSLEGNPLEMFFNWAHGTRIEKHHDNEVIVSMTSHPPRIHTTWLSILSILRQDTKPNHVILYLAEEDFPHHNLPKSLLFLQKKGLEVRYSKTNYKVATKLIPALQDFPNSVIITADDDRIYTQGWLQALLDQHKKHPKNIISPSARQFVFTEGHHYGNPKSKNYPHIDYLEIKYNYHKKKFSIFEGFAGVLYPPRALHQEVFNFNNFRVLTPYADDVWFQTMAILQGTKTRGLHQDIQEKYQWPPEVEGTQASGLFHKHLRANDWMAYRALYYYGLLETLEIPTFKSLKCQACKRDVQLYEPQEKLIPSKRSLEECPTCLNGNKRKILCIGAYPYGNIGDHMYELVLGQYLGKNFQVHFTPDTARINNKGKWIEMNSQDPDLDFDALLIGGGGILRDFLEKHPTHYYMQKAIENEKPFFIVSAGLQTEMKDPSSQDAQKIIGSSVDLIRQASLIFVRSMKDRVLLGSVLEENISYKLFVAPDLGYLYPKMMNISPASQKKYITLIQTGSASVENEYVRQVIAKAFKENPSAKLIVMNWGGSEEPKVTKDFREFDLFMKNTKTRYPDAKVYMGNAISSELKEFRYAKFKTRNSDLTPEKAVKKIAKSHLVITGRYHGLVIAKALGVPCITPISTHKVLAEKESPLDITKADLQLKKITNFVLENSASLLVPLSWNNDHRNTYIVKAHETFGLPIPYLQSMDNVSIYRLLAFGNGEE